MSASTNKGWFTEHRGWEDIVSAACGVLIVLSPALATEEAGAAMVISAGLAGVLITMLAMLELMEHQHWEEVAELTCGLWVVLSPLLLDYGGLLGLSHYLLGVVVAALALLELWQDRSRQAVA